MQQIQNAPFAVNSWGVENGAFGRPLGFVNVRAALTGPVLMCWEYYGMIREVGEAIAFRPKIIRRETLARSANRRRKERVVWAHGGLTGQSYRVW